MSFLRKSSPCSMSEREMIGAGVFLEDLYWRKESSMEPYVFRNSHESRTWSLKKYHGFIMVWKHTNAMYPAPMKDTYTIALNLFYEEPKWWRYIGEPLEAQAIFEHCVQMIEPPPPLYKRIYKRLWKWAC